MARAGGGPAPSRPGPAGASELFQGSGEEAVGKKATQNATCRVSRLDVIRQLSKHRENHCA